MACLPEGFWPCLAEIHRDVAKIDGFLTDRETEFLALLAACPTTDGVILEIGSLHGRSTTVLAKAARLAGSGEIVAVDPLPERVAAATDEHPRPSPRALFEANLRRAGIREQVQFYQTTSGELGKSWDRPIRLLWVDGDHSYPGAKLDFDTYSPFLTDGAIIAFHDVLHPIYEGPCRVFMDDVLLGGRFGPVGVCGSIGWGKYRQDRSSCDKYRNERSRLYLRLASLVAYRHRNVMPGGLCKYRFRLLRWRVPHYRVKAEQWLKNVA